MLLTQPNTKQNIQLWQRHDLPLPSCCPVSGNPQPGSVVSISYRPHAAFIEVYSLRKYIDSYVGGKDGVRDMEGMIQQIAADCAAVVGVAVTVRANIILQRGDKMRLTARAK